MAFLVGLAFALPCLASGEDAAQKIFTQAPQVAPAAGAPPATAAAPQAKPDRNAGPTPSWIWGADTEKQYFARKTFTAPAGIKAAHLEASCDNSVRVFVNGQPAGSSDEWNEPLATDVSKFLKPGENVLTAEITNHGGPAAFVLELVLTLADGKTEKIVTDGSWQMTEHREGGAGSPAKIVAKYGAAPWGPVFDNVSGGSKVARNLFNLPPGFQVELLFTVPKSELGSWVCITTDNKGRLIVSDQDNKGLCRVTPSPVGSQEPTQVERLDVKMSGAQGMLWAFDSLYVTANGGPGSGLYRLRDTNGDDQFDEVVKLKEFRGGGEHGPHSLRLSPDGKRIVAMAGNHTRPPFDRELNSPVQTMGGVRPEQLHATLPPDSASRLMPNWDEDLLLPRQWDGNGHAAGILAPGGWIAKTDPDGKTWDIIASGFRNEFDMAFNADGELFVYDADMEWDYGMPWYRPTRVVHARERSRVRLAERHRKVARLLCGQSAGAIVDIGPGSPVGVEFGYGAKFPAKYQKALFICDWTFGTMYAIHLTPSGASYRAEKEEFVSRTPLPLTDVTVGRDGAMYFTIGGRGGQSELYRVTYVGSEPTTTVDMHDPRDGKLRKLRHEIEAYHRPGADAAKATAFLAPLLGHADRTIRYAARVGARAIAGRRMARSRARG